MKRTLRSSFATLIVVAIGCASAMPATASSWARDCGSAKVGRLTADQNWETYGPWYVKMSSSTAQSIARRVRPHRPARDIPCRVASTVAQDAATAWTLWGNIQAVGVVSVRMPGHPGGPKLGQFRCAVAWHTNDGGANLTCVHHADHNAGSITVKLDIVSAPGA